MPGKVSELVLPHLRIEREAVNQDQRMAGACSLIIQVGAIDRDHICNLFHWLSSSRSMRGLFRNAVRRDLSLHSHDVECASAPCLRGLRRESSLQLTRAQTVPHTLLYLTTAS